MPDFNDPNISKECLRCREKVTAKSKDGDFDVDCTGIFPAAYKLEQQSGKTLTDAQTKAANSLLDPIGWAAAVLDWHPRESREGIPYQATMLRCDAKRKISRIGRRSGKTDSLCVNILYNASTRNGHDILVVCPQKSHAQVIYDRLLELIFESNDLKNSLKRNVKTPYAEIELHNGSIIKLFTSGSRSGSKGDGVRGQCISGDSTVLMASGEAKNIKDIVVGDKVVSINKEDDKTVGNVSHVFEPNTKELFEVKLESGRSVSCSKDHELYGRVGTRHNSNVVRAGNKFEWKSLKEWRVGDNLSYIADYDLDKRKELDEDEISFAAYMIGDGSCGQKTIDSGKISFTNENIKILNDFTGILDKQSIYFGVYDKKETKRTKEIGISGLKIKHKHILDILEKYEVANKLSYDKHVPSIIKTSTKENKKLFIRKLFATDGWCCYSNQKRGPQVEIGYCTVSKRLAHELQELLAELGVVSKIQERDKKWKHYNTARQYIVKVRSGFYVRKFLSDIGYIYGKEDICAEVFDLVKDATKSQYHKSENNNVVLDTIKSISYIGKELAYDIEVSDTHNFIANNVIVHNSADALYLDEADYLDPDDLNAIGAILYTNPNVTLWTSSTPTGRRERFYDQCHDSRFREFHYPSTVLPFWNDQMDRDARLDAGTEAGYQHEILAEFGEEVEGVYQNQYVDKALTEYKYEEQKRMDGWIYTMGVDWNDTAIGTQICIIGNDTVNNKYRVVAKHCVDRVGWTQLAAIDKIREVNKYWQCAHIYCDAGFGTTQIELLQQFGERSLNELGAAHPDSMLRYVKGISAGGTLETRNIRTGITENKPSKPYMIENSVRYFEHSLIELSKHDDELEQELLGYVVERRTQSGAPVYAQGNKRVGDHELDAMVLALLAFTMEYTEFGQSLVVSAVSFGGTFGDMPASKKAPMPGTIELVIENQYRRKQADNKRDTARPQERFAIESDAILSRGLPGMVKEYNNNNNNRVVRKGMNRIRNPKPSRSNI